MLLKSLDMKKDPTKAFIYIAIVLVILWRVVRSINGEFN